MRVNALHRDGSTGVHNQSRRTQVAALGVDYQGNGVRLEADLGYQDISVDGIRRFTRIANGIALPDAPDSRSNWFNPSEFSQAKLRYAATRGEVDLNAHVTAFVAFGGSEMRYARLLANRTLTNSAGDLAAGSFAQAHDMRYRAHSMEGGLRSEFRTGPISHQAVLSYSYGTMAEARSPQDPAAAVPFPASNIYRPVHGATPSRQTPGFDTVFTRSRNTSSGLAIADTLSMLDSRIQLSVGARLQKIRSANYHRVTGAQTARYNDSAVAPMVGLVVKPWQNTSLYANYIEALQQGPRAPDSAANAGEVFSPYSSDQYEVGVKQEIGGVIASLALWQLSQPNTTTDARTNVFGLFGERRHRGIDLSAAGTVMPRLRMLGGITYIQSRLSGTQGGLHDGNRGVGTPKWRAVVGAEWDVVGVRGLSINGRVIHNGASYLDNANTQQVDAWTRVDLGARYQVNSQLNLGLFVENAFGKDYWTTSGENELTLSAPRSVRLSATWDF